MGRADDEAERGVGGERVARGRLHARMARAQGRGTNPIGVEWFGLVMGLGFVLSFGYWCTDFLVVQRAMAADSMTAARRTPLIAAFPKMFFPFLVILPGMIALALTVGVGRGSGDDSREARRRGSPLLDARAEWCWTTTSRRR